MSNTTTPAQNNEQIDELSEDMIVVGPGQMIAEGRKKLSFSVDDVANKLKFRTVLVQNIEQDIFDQALPATYNRGYLRSYAKLVNIDADEVLSAYDMLGVAEIQRSEMQSFSNLTEKQAEHSRLMWLTYLIVAILLGLMVLWWLQDSKLLFDEKTPKVAEQVNKQVNKQESIKLDSKSLTLDNTEKEPEKLLLNIEPSTQEIAKSKTAEPIIAEPKIIEAPVVIEDVAASDTSAKAQEQNANISTVIFTFSGDCWVNIYDATGERIAWGVKKLGYVMTVKGKAPLKITLGKPELASIVFNGQTVDMTPFNVGNIAKFTLPLKAQ